MPTASTPRCAGRTAGRGGRLLPVLVLFLVLIAGSRGAAAANKPDPAAIPPRVPREFRGAWVATVANLDWPSRPGLPVDEQKAELSALLDRAVQSRLNAIIFQVRPSCDAFYASKLEPWSEYLTGQSGRAPEPFYDPLSYAIQQAHARGLELHAWFNPFRARMPGSKAEPAANHLTRIQPGWVRNYGPQRWLDPSVKGVRDHAIAVILDVVRRYDIDGVHVDDYFYPYREKNLQGQAIEFPDEANWTEYQRRGGNLERADWRRQHVNEFIETLYRRIKAEKAHVKFGISPFGIWRPGVPTREIVGLDAFDQLYADARLWLAKGWCDYFAPQLYWAIQPAAQSYPVLLRWWAGQNAKGRHLWPGNNATRVGTVWKPDEIINQVRITRTEDGASGNIFWNAKSLAQNGLGNALVSAVYSQRALIPASPWLGQRGPAKPKVSLDQTAGKPWRATWTIGSGKPVRLRVLQWRTSGKWSTDILPAAELARIFADRPGARPDRVAVTAVDRLGNLSPTTIIESAEPPRRIASAAQP